MTVRVRLPPRPLTKLNIRMSSYLIGHLEVKCKDEGKWSHISFGPEGFWRGGNVRNFFSYEQEGSNMMPADISEETKADIEGLGYTPRVYIYSIDQLNTIVEAERNKWIASYREALSRNFFVRKLCEVTGKPCDTDNSDEYIYYLESDEIFTWVGLDEMHSVFKAMIASTGKQIEDARVIFYID